MASTPWLHFSLFFLASSFHVLNGALNHLPDFWAVEETDVIFEWNTASQLKNIEWFFPMVGDTTLVYYDAVKEKTEVNPLYQVAYGPEYGSAAMILFSISTDNSSTYAVRVTTQNNTLEEETTNLTVITKSKLLEELAITVNGKDVNFGINYIETGDLLIQLSPPAKYGAPNIMCYSSEKSPQVLKCTDTICKFNINGVSPRDKIVLNMTYSLLQVTEEFEFLINGSTTSGLSAGAVAGIVIGVFCVCVIVIIVVIFLMKAKTNKDTSSKNDSVDNGQKEPSTPATVSEVTVKDDRIPNSITETPRKLPPLSLPPMNKVNPDDYPDDQQQEKKKKKKKKKHKKRHEDEKEQNVDPKDNEDNINDDGVDEHM